MCDERCDERCGERASRSAGRAGLWSALADQVLSCLHASIVKNLKLKLNSDDDRFQEQCMCSPEGTAGDPFACAQLAPSP